MDKGDLSVEYKKVVIEEARLLGHLAECAKKRAALLELEIEFKE